MTKKLNKIQIRAELFSIINKLLISIGNNSQKISEEIGNLNNIEDKDFLAKLLIKEFIATEDTNKSTIISLIIINCIPIEILENNLWSNLALKSITDEKKYQLIDLLKSMGKFIEYEKYIDYFEDPQKIIDIDTKKLLKSAMLNPEAQIDFLDFLETLSKTDKMLLLDSMFEDYTNDDLANIISPLILYETDEKILEQIINMLIKTKSNLAYFPLENFSIYTKNEDLKKLSIKALKELKLMGINKESAKAFYAKSYKDTILYNCYASTVDGTGNQGLLFSRIRNDNSIQIFCVVINDITGIIDCFGFNTISSLEFSLILKKFSEEIPPFKISFETGLLLINEAEKISYKKGLKIPYEYICWKGILFDIEEIEKASAKIFHDGLSILPPKNCDFEEIFSSSILDKLFFTKNDNENFSKFITTIDKEIAITEEINIKEIENKIFSNVTTIFNEETKEVYVNRLLKIAFLLFSNSQTNLAAQIYNLSQNEKCLLTFFKESLKKSFFVYYNTEFRNRYSNTNNIFAKKMQKDSSQINNEKLKDLLDKILTEWGRDD